MLIKNDEWEQWKSEFKNVKISTETFNIINSIKLELEKQHKKLDCYISDRRWSKSAELLKASAYFCGRDETNIVDCLLLSHCLWSTKDNREKIVDIVEDAVRKSGLDTKFNMNEIDEEKDDLKKDIQKTFYYTKDIYETKKIKGNSRYFKCIKTYQIDVDWNPRDKRITFYIPTNKLNTNIEFHPIDDNGNELENIKCNFNKQSICSLKILSENNYGRNTWLDLEDFKPKVQFYKDDKKEVEDYVIDHFKNMIKDLSLKLKKIIEDVENKKLNFLNSVETPFILDEKIKIVIESIDMQITDLKVRYKDCESLNGRIE